MVYIGSWQRRRCCSLWTTASTCWPRRHSSARCSGSGNAVTLLATSREPLAVGAERCFPYRHSRCRPKRSGGRSRLRRTRSRCSASAPALVMPGSSCRSTMRLRFARSACALMDYRSRSSLRQPGAVFFFLGDRAAATDCTWRARQQRPRRAGPSPHVARDDRLELSTCLAKSSRNASSGSPSSGRSHDRGGRGDHRS